MSQSQTEQEEAGLDPVAPSGSLSPDTVIYCSWRAVNSFLFSTRAGHTVHQDGGARGLKGFRALLWMRHLMGSMPEMETNHVKTKQVGLASRGWAESFHLPHLFPSHGYLIWSKDQQEAEPKRNSTGGKYNGTSTSDSLPHTDKEFGAYRLRRWPMLNAELTKFLDSQDSEAFWDCGTVASRVLWLVRKC